jgi:hypothetical protein
MNIFGRFFNSKKLKSEILTDSALFISKHGYNCQDWNPAQAISLYDYALKYPEKNVFTINLNIHNVTLKIDNDRGLVAFAGDFSTHSKENEFAFWEEIIPFFDWLFINYGFKFGFIDKEGDTSEKLFQFIERLEIENLFYTNYFSKEWLHKHGEDYFLKAPGQTVVLEDGSIRYYPKKSIRKTEKEEALALKHYFNNVKIFNAKKSDDW